MQKTVTGRPPSGPASHRASWIGLVVERTPAGRALSSREHTATIAPVRPARRQASISCASRSSVGTATSTRPRAASRWAATAPMAVLPVPVASTAVARRPFTAATPGTGVSARVTASTASS